MRVDYEVLETEFERILEKHAMEREDSKLCATLFAQASLDGVSSHGLNRFPVFIDYIEKGLVDVHAKATLLGRFGCLERWDGNAGPGNLNAYASMTRAIALAKENTIGCVALANTNHWMRAGSYGLLAAQQDCIGILWTNTIPNMPPWGGLEAKLGNNPVVFAIPHADSPILVDIAMSLFSYGKMENYAREKKDLPFDGGFDTKGGISKDPAEILQTQRTLPIGFWKGSGLSLALDLIAASLSGGLTTYEVGKAPAEASVSQLFVAISLANLPDREAIEAKITATLDDLHATRPIDAQHPVHFPGEGMKKIREENLEKGIPVDEVIWKRVCAM
ncbi:malate/lactate dehydrogenase [Sphaerochaeta pleomorpha str. Grapes]|uniref:Malate/lactate dehydrogenase n=1 Tax=Sphaerochaeta pleomorpha (strain ATCC BAA-1885 / DSM 22778 / Grapes) TaxID=158190 RepID=G8QUM9_SPHPG|nr:3-dehydro-L-gulonate 2-dehydrogenase [Sphaerochaeta pleomorpha]AEV30337.1 malate/lactate dehydrogenase [Sphaerochaeta pleomorpha str. Grapes]